MSLFLLASVPLYLCLTICSTTARIRLLHVVRYCSLGIFAYIPIYLLSRIISAPGSFAWNILSVFMNQLLRSRGAFSRFAAAFLLLCVILQHYRSSAGQQKLHNRSRPPSLRRCLPLQRELLHPNELFCWISGYFFAENFHDFLLLGPFPTVQDLFFRPLSRILFAQFLVFALYFLQLLRHPQKSIRHQAFTSCIAYFLLAFVLMSIFASIAIIFNAYWIISLIMLGVLLLYFTCFYWFNQPGQLQSGAAISTNFD